MFGKIAFASLAVAGTTLFAAAPAQAAAHPTFCVEYRQCQWREREFFDPGQAQGFAERKRCQGFEVAVSQHRNHFDVRFRMPLWQTYRTVFSRHEAHELSHMLRSRGYEVRVH
jgi:predicted aminopeptidase